MSYDLWSRLRYVLSPQFDIYEQVSKVVSGHVADIGCGTGFGTHLFTRNAKTVTGYEIDNAGLQFAERAFSNGNIRFLRGDILNMPKVPDFYDFVTMIDVIEHIKDDRLAIRSSKDMLSPGGKLICSTPNLLSRYRKSDYHVKEYSPDMFIDLMKTSFEDVTLVDYRLKPIKSKYSNPILAICK